MRGRLGIKFKLILFLMVICISGGFLAAYKIYNPSKEASSTWIVPSINNSSKKFIIKEALVNEIQQKKELVTLEIDLTEKITIDDSWGDIDLFKKVQNVYLIGRGIYSIDLAKISANNLTLTNKNTIIISVPEPAVKMITVNEQKTIYETAQNGPLRFGEITLEPSEYQGLLDEAKTKMKEKMESKELYDQAVLSSELAIKDLIKSLIDSSTTYTIDVQFQ